MSTPLTLSNYAAIEQDFESAHRRRVRMAWAAALSLMTALAIYGFNYYVLSAADRPFSPKHHLLKPSGTVGIKLGMLGVGLFCTIFLYPLRKRIPWLGRQGKAKHWLDFHVVAGVSAPVIIAFHASFKFSGIAGVAYWIMFAVALSGVAGRYIYAQIPRSLTAAELSMRELLAMEQSLAGELAEQHVVATGDLDPLFRIPSAEEVRAMPVYRAMLLMLALDLARPWQIARIRARVLGWRGYLPAIHPRLRANEELEHIISTARRKASLAKRITFLARTQQIFHLWHVIHRPFSYSFAVLAIIHIVVVLSLGYM